MAAAGTKAVHRSGFDQGFDGGLVAGNGSTRSQKSKMSLKGPFFLRSCGDRNRRRSAAAFDRRKGKVDLAVGDREVGVAGVDVRMDDFDPHPVAVFHVLDQRVFAFEVPPRDIAGQQRRHEFDRIVGFQVGGLKGDQRVGGTVGFIETIAREFDDQVPDVFGVFFGEPIFDASPR